MERVKLYYDRLHTWTIVDAHLSMKTFFSIIIIFLVFYQV